jgi:hypothetical protein
MIMGKMKDSTVPDGERGISLVCVRSNGCIHLGKDARVIAGKVTDQIRCGGRG